MATTSEKPPLASLLLAPTAATDRAASPSKRASRGERSEWHTDELLALAQAVHMFGEHDWASVSVFVGRRHSIERFANHFAPLTCQAEYGRLVRMLASSVSHRSHDPQHQRARSETVPQQLFHKLLARRNDEIKMALQRDELEYRALMDEITSINSGAWDETLIKGMPNGPSGSLPPQGPLQDAQLDQGSLQAAHAVQPAHEHEPSAPAEKEPSKESRDAHMADVEASGMATSSSVAELDSETSDKSAIIPGDDASEASRQQDLSADVGMAISTSVESSTSTTDPSQLDKTRDSLHHHAHGHHLPQHMLPQLNIKSLSSKSDRDTPQSGGQTGPDGEPFSSSVVGDLESSAEFSDGLPDRKRVRIDEKYKTWKRTAMIIWNRIADHRAGNAFLKNIRDKEYTDYVKQPMSLDHVKARIREGKTRTTAQFHRDVLHILANAIMFNPEDSEIYAKACEMREYVDSEMRNLLVYNRSDVVL